MPMPQPATSVSVTFSLEEAAAILCGAAGPSEQRWVLERLRGNRYPTLPGYRVQKRWRMTQADIDASIELLRPNVVRIPTLSSLTTRSARRLAV